MTREEACAQLKACQEMFDIEVAHSRADMILVEFLDGLGYEDITEEWDKVGKWYA